ncbi:MAG TPA: hypothetical protein VMW94_08685 [Actinomycetes bacterium]|nr:hypothetical protein [Actinomycetes bacterium]
MITAALLPTPGDPLLARYWLRNYETWRDEVDTLVVYVNGGSHEACHAYLEAGATVLHDHDGPIGHGQALRRLVDDCGADAVVLMEDDAFVRRRGAVASCLRHVLDRDVVIGCPRGGMDPAIGVAAQDLWGEATGPDGSSGHGLWPAFLFARANTLRQVQTFASTTWRAGETVPGLGYRCPTDMTTDTMTAAAFELRARVPIEMVGNWKEIYQKQFVPGAPWFHAGGLSNDPASARAGMGDSNEGRDWAHRFWWWRRIGHDYSEHIARAGVDVDYWTPIVEPWINWEDR